MTSWALAPDLSAVRHARGLARQSCEGLDPAVCDVVVLLTSEAVTNAFVHGRSHAQLTVTVLADRVLVEVGDDNSRHPRQPTRDDDALDGRGVMLMSELSDHWGVRDEPVGKTVWFEVSSRPG